MSKWRLLNLLPRKIWCEMKWGVMSCHVMSCHVMLCHVHLVMWACWVEVLAGLVAGGGGEQCGEQQLCPHLKTEAEWGEERGHPHYRGGAHTEEGIYFITKIYFTYYIDSLQVKLFSNRNQLHITIMNDYVMGNICFIHRLDNGHPPAIHQDIEFYLNLCHWKLPWLYTFVSYPAVLETLHLCGVWKKNETLFSVRTTRPLAWLWKVWTMALVKVSRESNDDWFWG